MYQYIVLFDLNNILFGLENRIQILYKFLSIVSINREKIIKQIILQYKESKINDKCLYLHTMILYKITLNTGLL